jgi:hypothetical protein
MHFLSATGAASKEQAMSEKVPGNQVLPLVFG